MMKKSRSVLVMVVIAALLAGLLVAVFKDRIIKSVVCSEVESQTGVPISIERIHYNPFKTTIEIDGLKMENPAEFGGGEALFVKRVFVDTSLSALLADEVHLDVCEIDIERIRLISTGTGSSNIEVLAKRMESETHDEEAQVGIPGGAEGDGQKQENNSAVDYAGERKSEDKEITIGYLKIRLGTIQMETESIGGRKMEPKEYVVDQVFEYRDVEDLDPVAQQMLMVIAVKTGPDLLKDFKRLLEENKDDLDAMEDGVKDAAKKLGDELKKLF